MIDILEQAKIISGTLTLLKKEQEELENAQSLCDKKISNYCHLFECCNLPAHIRSKADRDFKQALIERREIKNKMASLTLLKTNLKNNNIPNIKQIEKAGTFKFKFEGFSEEEIEVYSKYVLSEFK